MEHLPHRTSCSGFGGKQTWSDEMILNLFIFKLLQNLVEILTIKQFFRQYSKPSSNSSTSSVHNLTVSQTHEKKNTTPTWSAPSVWFALLEKGSFISIFLLHEQLHKVCFHFFSVCGGGGVWCTHEWVCFAFPVFNTHSVFFFLNCLVYISVEFGSLIGPTVAALTLVSSENIRNGWKIRL